MISRLAAAVGVFGLAVASQGAGPRPTSPAEIVTPLHPRYQAEAGAFVGRNLDGFNNRPLYCANTNAFVLAGDRPLVRFARGDRHYGTFVLGIAGGNGETLWLHDSDEVTTTYRAGRMTWTVQPSRVPGLVLTWDVQPVATGVGLTARLAAAGVRPGDRLIWAYGGASGRTGTNLSNALDTLTMRDVRTLGFDPARCAGNRISADNAGFALRADAAGPVIRGRWSAAGPLLVGSADSFGTPLDLLAGAGPPGASVDVPERPIACGVVALDTQREVYWSFLAEGGPVAGSSGPAEIFAAASARTKALAERVVVDTPDPYLNAAAGAAAAAIDGVWYPPVFVHGAMMWNMRFPGWRTVYGGTVYGWHERVRAQAEYYLASQESGTTKTSFAADPATLLTEAARDSRFYGSGRITRDQKFYNMQSQFFEQLIHAWRWTGDPTLETTLRPALERHLDWQRECFDPDGDGTYESYINTWPTDSVWFNGGGTPDETAYAYSGHLAARDLARRAGDAPAVARHEQRLVRIREGFFRELWNPVRGHPGLYREQGGHRRLHDDAWLYSVFLPIGAGLLDSGQALTALRYTEWGLENERLPTGGRRVWTSNFVPGIWSVREMWPGDNYHLALAYFQAGLAEDGWEVFRGNFVHSAFNQPSPGNLGAPQGGTDFGDCVHPFARTLVEGLFGYAPDYPNDVVRLTPQFPAEWGHAQIRTPDFGLRFERSENVTAVGLTLRQPAPVDLVVPIRARRVAGVTVNRVAVPWRAAPGYGCTRLSVTLPAAVESLIEIHTEGAAPTPVPARPEFPGGGTRRYASERTEVRVGELPQWRVTSTPAESFVERLGEHVLPAKDVPRAARWAPIDLERQRNADLRAIFRQTYLSPRPATISVRLGSDGYSPWTFPHWKSGPPEIGLEAVPGLLSPDAPRHLRTPQGVPFLWANGECNIAFTSLWDNFPRAVTVPVGRAGEAVWFLVAGSTNPMQGRIANAVLRLRYADGGEQRLELVPPFNYWNLCPIRAGATAAGQESRTYYTAEIDRFAVPRPWPETVELGANCRAILLSQRLRPGVVLEDVTLEALSQEVVVGLLGVTLMNPDSPGRVPAVLADGGLPATPLPPAPGLRNPVWVSTDNLRDPSVLVVEGGYQIFYSRLAGTDWASPESWTIARAFTRDFSRFDDITDISPKGHASPGDIIRWHGRWLLPYQSYPARPTRLCVSESTDLKAWSAPRTFLAEAAELPWNTYRRVIDPTFVVEGDTLHCYFVGSADVTDAAGRKLRANLLGHAVTSDPALERWEILSREAPLIGHSATAPDGVENVMVLRTGDHWTMIYSEGLARQRLALATSTDLRRWRLEGPIEIPRQTWMARKYGAPFVWREGDGWRMILMGENDQRRTTFGLLSSPDARRWTPLPE